MADNEKCNCPKCANGGPCGCPGCSCGPLSDVEASTPRKYVTNLTHLLPDQYKHDACDAEYVRRKTGLKKI